MGTPTNGQHEVSAERAVPRSALEQMPRAELFALARKRGILNTMVMTRSELLEAIDGQQAELSPRNGHGAPPELVVEAGVREQPRLAKPEAQAELEADSAPAVEPEPEATAGPAPGLEGRAKPEPEPTVQPRPDAAAPPDAEPEPQPDPESGSLPRPGRPTAAHRRTPERQTGVPMAGVAAAAVATAVFLWHRRR